MAQKIEHNGQSYQNINGEWYDTNFIRAPLALAQELNALAGVERQPARQRATKRNTASAESDGESAFSHADAFPFVAEIIRELAPQDGEFVRHRQIVAALASHPEAQGQIEEAIARKGHTALDWCHWIVQWFSAAITQNNSPFAHDFERRREKDGWAYRPVQKKL